jgi:nucleoside-diphosphate-sugar epimerase
MRSAFVLGGTGQVGRAVCQRLGEAGWDVTAGARGKRAAPEGVRTVAVDRQEEGVLENLLEGVDVLIHVIPMTARDAEQVNGLTGQIGSVVAISSASVYADERGRTLDEATDLASFPELSVPIPETQRTVEPSEETYSTRKVAMERTLMEGSLPATIIRPCAIHGPSSTWSREWHFVKRALDGRRVVLLPDRGESRFHTTSVANLAELVFLAAERPADRILNCGDPDPPTVLQIERAIAGALNHRWDEVPLPKHGYEVPAVETPWSVPRPFILDMTKAKRELGYQPVVRYEEAVPETVAWLIEATRTRDWRAVMPDTARVMENSFDYQREDALLANLRHESKS